jgi:hypothetical protein
MTRYLFFALLLAAMWSCQNEVPASSEAAPEPVSIDSLTYALICVDITQPGDQTPHHDVFAVAGKDTFRVGTIEACERIDPANYADYEIPENALAAVGGKNADKTIYAVYIDKSEAGKINARIGDMYPGKPSGSFDYRTWVVLTEEDVQFSGSASLSPNALVGSYVHNGTAASHVLYLGLSHRTVVGQIYTLQGPLPEDDSAILEAIAQTQPEFIPNIQVSFTDLSFSCSKGKGSFQARDGQVQSLTFADWEGKGSLTLEKRAVGSGQ